MTAHAVQVVEVPSGLRGTPGPCIACRWRLRHGTGFIAIGWLSEHEGFSRAFAVAAMIATLSIPYFLFMEKRQWTTSALAPPV